jgi:hypothetical protein
LGPHVTIVSQDPIIAQAAELTREYVPAPEAATALLAAAGGRRAAVVAARNEVAAHLHGQVDDFEATAILQILNRALSQIPIHDPLDWRVRWTQRFRRP